MRVRREDWASRLIPISIATETHGEIDIEVFKR